MGNYKIHGSGLSAYTGAPQIYADIDASISRTGNSQYVSAKVSASLNGLGGQSYFGYSLNLYAGLDDNEPSLLFTKPAVYPNQWSSGIYSGSVNLSSYNLTAKATLKIYLQSDCECEGGQRKVVRTISLDTVKYIPSYTITYNANGGSGAPSSQSKQEGQSVIISTAPSTSKYYTITYDPGLGSMSTRTQNKYCNFNSWNTSSSGSGSQYSPGDPYSLDSSTTLYAIWDNPIISSTLPVSRDGFALEGWYDEYGTRVTSNYVITRNLSLTAQWTSLTYYDISYDSNGGGPAPEPDRKRSDRDEPLASPPSPKQYIITFDGGGGTIDGQSSKLITHDCSFAGWLGGGRLYPLGASYAINEDVTMVAQWNNPKIQLPSNPVNPNFTFMGWYTSSGQPVGSDYILTGSETIIARWATFVYQYQSDHVWRPIRKAKKFNGNTWEDAEVHYNIESGGSE